MIKVSICRVSDEKNKEIKEFKNLDEAFKYCQQIQQKKYPELWKKGWGTEIIISRPKKKNWEDVPNYEIDTESDLNYEMIIEDDWRY
ncbi:MAG: hypothetical protein K0S93_167 [Nitrososphaeraceae archaeon]|jgi:hypothetical protein|nr:hypothetical protein [Nitrososphaeraceae archaeon]